MVEKTLKEGVNLEAPMGLTELEECLKSFKKAKTPGADGLPCEFYQTFWDIVGPDLETVYQEFDGLDLLPDCFREGVVKLASYHAFKCCYKAF